MLDIEKITLTDKVNIESARAIYNGLSETMKSIVPETIVTKIVLAEKAIYDIEVVNEFLAKMNAIGEVSFNDVSQQAIISARESYEDLTEDQKAIIVSIDILTSAEETYAEFAINAINDLIDKETITLEIKDDVVSAREIYTSLTDEEKNYVSDEVLAKIVSAEQEIIDIESANYVIGLIDVLPVDITIDDRDNVILAKNSYELLTDDQKAKISTELSVKLNEAVLIINGIDAVNDFITKMNAIGNVIYNDECKQAIISARTAYNALTDKQKANVGDISILTNAESVYTGFVATEIYALIDIDNITIENKVAIESAKTIYDGLNEKMKSLISAKIVTKLMSAVETIANIEAVNDFITKMNAIGQVNYDNDSKQAIELARNTYNALTDEQKTMTDSIETLTEAEKIYTGFATTEIRTLVNVDNITLDNKDDVVLAREIFDSLTKEEQLYVSEKVLAKLVSAERYCKICQRNIRCFDRRPKSKNIS